MKRIWTIRGTYLNWEMTVKVRPADESPTPVTEQDQGSALARMKRVSQYFFDTANLHEFSLECNDLRPGVCRTEALQFVPGEPDAGQGGGD